LENILSKYCPSNDSCYLAFVDPQGITDLKWSTLQKLLTHGKGDVILNFPTSGIIRNLDIAKDALTQFFGDENWCNINPSSDDLIQYYMNKISHADGYARNVDNIPVIDESNHRLYDLIFATGSRGMTNVLSDLKNRLGRLKTRDFREIHKVVAGPQTQLTGFPA